MWPIATDVERTLVYVCVYVCVGGHNCELCKNGLTNQDEM